MDEIIIIGIGNPYRGDDGAGWAVIDALASTIPPAIKTIKLRGDVVELLDAFANYPAVYLIDACYMDALPGFWQRLDAHCTPLPPERAQTSTHGLGISQAIDLAKALDQLPPKLIIYAINGDHYNMSLTLSPPVAQAIGPVAQSVLNEEEIQG